jgi:hypothetical protein
VEENDLDTKHFKIEYKKKPKDEGGVYIGNSLLGDSLMP